MSAWRSLWSGVAAGFAFVVVELLGRLIDRVPTLPELIQDRLVLLLPGPVFSFFLDRLLYLGKPLLFWSLLLAQVALGGLAGIAIGRWARFRLLSMAVVAPWLLTGIVLLPLAGQGVFAGSLVVAVVLLLAFAAYGLAFVLFAGPPMLPMLAGTRPAPAPAPGPAGRAGGRLDRRRLLAGSALAVTSAALAGGVVGRLPALPSRGRALAGEDGSSNAASPAARGAGSLPLEVTPADQFYVVSKNLLDPELDGGAWQLRIDGMVDHPLTLRYADLLAMPSVTVERTLECVSNEVGGDLISNGQWTGVRLADLLTRAGVQAGAQMLAFTSADHYTATLRLAQGLDPNTLLAYQLDGKPLPSKHGFPARILATGIYGMKNPKWLTHIEVVRSAGPGFWQQQGWDEEGVIQTMSRIDMPEGGARLQAGTVTIGGIAFAGDRGISRVEVSHDGGTSWNDAMLQPALGPSTWSFWQYVWQPALPGSYTILARATDGTGAVQPSRRMDPFPSGATGYPEVDLRLTMG